MIDELAVDAKQHCFRLIDGGGAIDLSKPKIIHIPRLFVHGPKIQLCV